MNNPQLQIKKQYKFIEIVVSACDFAFFRERALARMKFATLLGSRLQIAAE
jgi:hypothetical protein